MDKIKDLKVQAFDLIRQGEMFQAKLNELGKQRNIILKELFELEQGLAKKLPPIKPTEVK